MRAAWLWEVVGLQAWLDSPGYRWQVVNRSMRDDTTGVTIAYRDRTPDDTICGARTQSPRPEQGELVCNVVVDHAEMPHIGAPAECVDQTCDHWRQGRRHLVVVGVRIVSRRR